MNPQPDFLKLQTIGLKSRFNSKHCACRGTQASAVKCCARKKMNRENLGQPDLEFVGFAIWISNRQFPDSKDYWDGNWVILTACCKAHLSTVYAQGSFLHLPELSMWRNALIKLLKETEGSAELKCMEPNLHAVVKLNKMGVGSFTVRITPDI